MTTKLVEWASSQPAWAVDALQRAALVDEITNEQMYEVFWRIGAAHGLPQSEELEHLSFDPSVLRGAAGGDQVVLCSLGPLQNVDRIADDQQIRFALDGITLIFGENGSGKSGFARAVRAICNCRIPCELKGNVFDQSDVDSTPGVRFSYKLGVSNDPIEVEWREGSRRPADLSSVAVLDTANAHVYVDGDNEILFLPPEVGCLTRLGQLYNAVANEFEERANTLDQHLQFDPRGDFTAGTAVWDAIEALRRGTSRSAIPTVQQLRDLAHWDDELEAELTKLEREIAESPSERAQRLERVSRACSTVAGEIEAASKALSQQEIERGRGLQSSKARADTAVEALAVELRAVAPIPGTGSGPWKELFQHARAFAAESQLRRLDDSFRADDPCPFCQQPLGPDAIARLDAFDRFVEGRANSEARKASEELDAFRLRLATLTIATTEQLTERLAEFGASNAHAEALVHSVISFTTELEALRKQFVGELSGEPAADLSQPDITPLTKLKEQGQRLAEAAADVAAERQIDNKIIQRAWLLRDKRTLNGKLDQMLKRRSDLLTVLTYRECIHALNTGPVSRLATSVRQELVTPELSARIDKELKDLQLTHIPLRFRESTRAGRSFFEIALDADTHSKKSEVLSEGEQRALSLACFLGDSHIANNKSAMILDDPVTSLDHIRLRSVADRLAVEAGKGRQVIIFTHNMLFYQEVLRSAAEANPPIPVHPCVCRQNEANGFGVIDLGDAPWVARKVQERITVLGERIRELPESVPADDDTYRRLCKDFYTDLRETWERAVEEVLLNGVVQRFGSDVKTQSLRGVEVSDEDYKIVFFAMKRASEISGHDRAVGRQMALPTRAQMRADLDELAAFRATRRRRIQEVQTRREEIENPPAATVG